MPGVNPIVTPQSQSAVTRAKLMGLIPSATFYWNPNLNTFQTWDSYVGINTAISNVALESGGNLEEIARNTAGLAGGSATAIASVGEVATQNLLGLILTQLQFIADALNATRVDRSSDADDTVGGS